MYDLIGKIITVTVDRPLGSYHPKYTNIYYPVNYGYVEGIIAPDGEELDAYILGISYPVKKFVGKVIAVIIRKNDIENKLVVAPINKMFCKEEIIELTFFQEQYFDSQVIM